MVVARLRVLALLVASFGVAAGAITSCGDSSSQLQTSLTSNQSGSVKPSDSPIYTVTVKNKGPGAATGVNVHVDLPTGFRFKTTTSIGGDGSRVQPLDPPVNSVTPEWGVWSLGTPTTQADGSVVDSEVDLTFQVDVGAPPGGYTMTAHAAGDATQGDVQAPALSIQVIAAPQLTLSVAVQPLTAAGNDLVTYTVTVTNKGSGNANTAEVLVTLPSGFGYNDTTSITGNASRSTTRDPAPRTEEAFFGDFTIPAGSDQGPGSLVIAFRARVPRTPVPGAYPVSVQISDDTGDLVTESNIHPVTVH